VKSPEASKVQRFSVVQCSDRDAEPFYFAVLLIFMGCRTHQPLTLPAILPTIRGKGTGMVFSSLSSLEDRLSFLEEGFAGFLGVLATEGDAYIGQLVAELLFHVAGLERFYHAAF